jgi:hypothetical protein
MNDGLGGLEDGGRDEEVGEGLKGDAQKQQRQGGKGKVRKLQLAVLEAREGLKGKAYCHQDDEAAQHRLTMRQKPTVRDGELHPTRDAHDCQRHRSPQRPEDDGEERSGSEVGLINRVGEGWLKADGCFATLKRLAGGSVEFVQQLL